MKKPQLIIDDQHKLLTYQCILPLSKDAVLIQVGMSIKVANVSRHMLIEDGVTTWSAYVYDDTGRKDDDGRQRYAKITFDMPLKDIGIVMDDSSYNTLMFLVVSRKAAKQLWDSDEEIHK